MPTPQSINEPKMDEIVETDLTVGGRRAVLLSNQALVGYFIQDDAPEHLDLLFLADWFCQNSLRSLGKLRQDGLSRAEGTASGSQVRDQMLRNGTLADMAAPVLTSLSAQPCPRGRYPGNSQLESRRRV